MFEPQDKARVFALEPGEDFPAALVAGLRGRMAGHPPEAMARVTLYVNTERMRRRIRELFNDGTPGFLPRLRLVTEAGTDHGTDLPPAHPALRRRLQLTQLAAALIRAQPDLAPASAAFELAGGLAALLDEAAVEGVDFGRILDLDVTDASGHWQRSLAFLRIVDQLVAAGGETMDAAHRQRHQTEALIRDWQAAPPADPVIIAGSTGSRGTTHLLMLAAARLPQGALVLPGFDRDLPAPIWAGLTGRVEEQDHPQYRFAALLRDLQLAPGDVAPWGHGRAPDPARNRLISMAMRPAPVTDGWRRDGPELGDLVAATDRLSLIEAADPRMEAGAIALALRQAVESGRRAALISPDRVLTRRVAAALDRWRIEPDDSAGQPLGLTITGRLIRQIAGLFGRRLTAEDLLILLKNPKVAAGGRRGPHLRLSRELEITLRRQGPAFPGPAELEKWAAAQTDPAAPGWAAWVGQCIDGLDRIGTAPLGELVEALVARGEILTRGPEAGAADGMLWEGNDGAEARKALGNLAEEAPHGGAVDPATFASILAGVLAGEVRDPKLPHPEVMIWGTLEARVMGADLVILGGLNDGVWPELPEPDPWLNRRMRAAAGLLLPERRIGLSAHDFQQAAGAAEVILSRAKRGADADQVPSRWVNRLTNLLDGLKDQRGPEALEAMRKRGQGWCDLARILDQPVETEPRAPRPSPAPPLDARPRRLSVTEIETLIRDPYQIYARHVLRLRPLPPLRHRPEAALRGEVLHKVLELALPRFPDLDAAGQKAHLLATGQSVLDALVPWPTARRFWMARLIRVADHFVTEEAMRARRAAPYKAETRGRYMLAPVGMEITLRCDRMDLSPDGRLWIYDYKSGKPPTPKQQEAFAKQLHVTAMIAEAGGIEGVDPAEVAGAEYIGLAARPETVPADLSALPLPRLREGLVKLFEHYLDETQGYTAQIARESAGEYNDYDHLARGGEWDLTQTAIVLPVGRDDGER